MLRFIAGAMCLIAACWPAAIATGLYVHVIRPGIGAGRNTTTFTQLHIGGFKVAVADDRFLALGCSAAALILFFGGVFLMFFWPREERSGEGSAD